MSRDGQERARRAREAYEQAQQQAGELAVRAAREAAAEEQRRIADNIEALTDASNEALERLESAGFPGCTEVTVSKPERIFFWGRYTRKTAVLGWQIGSKYSEVAGSSMSTTYYLAADGTFVYAYFSTSDYSGDGYFGAREISVDRMATSPQGEVDGYLRAINTLGQDEPQQ